jgi:hypothetical protein
MNIKQKTALRAFCKGYLLQEFNALKEDEKQRILELFRDFMKLCLLRRRMVGNAGLN